MPITPHLHSLRIRPVVAAISLACTLGACSAGSSLFAASIATAGVKAGAGGTTVAVRAGTSKPLRVTDAQRRELFNALDLSRPGLETVRAAVDRGDLVAAQKAFAEYLRNRDFKTWSFDPRSAQTPNRSIRFDRKVADAATQGKVEVVSLWKEFPDNRIDWLHNETRARKGQAYNPEWQWQLCRMGFWPELAKAWRATGEQRYADAWVAQFRSFVEQCPPPQGQANKHGSAWRTLEAAIRISRTWPESFHSFLLSPSVQDEDLMHYALLTLHHGRYLRAWPTSANWLATEMAGLYNAGVVFPEFKEAKDWRDTAAGRLQDEVAIQFLPDGAHYEYSTGYHNGALNSFLGIPSSARTTGRMDELPADYVRQLEGAFDFNLYLMTPDRDLPRFNDGWPQDVAHVLRSRALEYFPNREDYRWVATNGRAGTPPTSAGETASHAFPYIGYYALRSGWERDANYAAFDNGKLGFGHVHQDCLNLVLWSYGREILFDSGGGSYERSKWRGYAIDTFSHNTVLVDGKPQRRQKKDREANVSREPVGGVWESTPQYDSVTGVYNDGYGAEDDRIATHMRSVYFHKPDVFFVADTLLPNDQQSHSYQARWHLLPTQTRTDAETGMVITTDAGLSNLAVIPLVTDGLSVRTVVAQTEPEILGWNLRKDMTPQNLPATSVIHERSGAGKQTFLTLLLPLPATADTAADPVKAIEPLTGGALRVALADGRIFTIRPGHAPDYQLSVEESLPTNGDN